MPHPSLSISLYKQRSPDARVTFILMMVRSRLLTAIGMLAKISVIPLSEAMTRKLGVVLIAERQAIGKPIVPV